MIVKAVSLLTSILPLKVHYCICIIERNNAVALTNNIYKVKTRCYYTCRDSCLYIVKLISACTFKDIDDSIGVHMETNE